MKIRFVIFILGLLTARYSAALDITVSAVTSKDNSECQDTNFINASVTESLNDLELLSDNNTTISFRVKQDSFYAIDRRVLGQEIKLTKNTAIQLTYIGDATLMQTEYYFCGLTSGYVKLANKVKINDEDLIDFILLRRRH